MSGPRTLRQIRGTAGWAPLSLPTWVARLDLAARRNPQPSGPSRIDQTRPLFGRAVGRGLLTTVSEYPTLDVVKTDIPSVAPPPPPASSRVLTLGSAAILAGVSGRTVDQLQGDLTRVLRSAQPNRQLVDLADDGSPKIPSLVAVFLLSQVGAAVGRPRLVNLSRVRREDMRSLGGVARLVHRTLHPVPAGPLAS